MSTSTQKLTEQNEDTLKETEASDAYKLAGSALMSFAPLNNIRQHLCAFHVYASDPTRHVRAHHLCSHLKGQNMHQCIIYDSNEIGARVIGIEYVVPAEVFRTLPEEEKKYWHSHKYEVESGMLQLLGKSVVPNVVMSQAEIPAMIELHDTYGKTIHTWQYDIHPDLPLGPPQLMMSYTEPSQVPWDLVDKRDKECGTSTSQTAEHRATYLPKDQLNAPVEEGCDEWTKGKGWQLKLVEEELKRQ